MITDYIGFGILVFSLILGIHMIYFNYLQYRAHPTWILALQLLACVCQLLNQTGFTLVFSLTLKEFFKSAQNCYYMWYFTNTNYSVYQILSIYVLVVRSSAILQERYAKIYRVCLLLMLAIAMGFITASAFQGLTFVVDDFCISTINELSNLVGKFILLIIHFIVCVVFVLIVHKKIMIKSKTRSAFIFGSVKVIVAVLASLISIIFSFTNIWGARFFIQFTVENYFGLIASTFVCMVPETGKDSTHLGSSIKKENE